VLRPGSHDGCQPQILDGYRPLDLTADALVPQRIGHFGCSDEATGLVTGHADPFGALADAEPFWDESPQRVHQSPLGLLARLDGTLASAGRAADSGTPLGGLWGPVLSLADQPVDATALRIEPRSAFSQVRPCVTWRRIGDSNP